MDAAVWAEVERCIDDRRVELGLDLADDINCVWSQIRALPSPFSLILRGWWEPACVDAVLRAGPSAARRIALIMLGLAALRHVGYPLSGPNGNNAIAAVGEVEVRALALSHCSHMDEEDGRRRGVRLRKYAHRLLEDRAVVLIPEGDVRLYSPVQKSFISLGNEIRIDRPISPALVLDADSLVTRLSEGVSEAQTWIEQQRCRNNQECLDAIDAARQRWSELDAA